MFGIFCVWNFLDGAFLCSTICFLANSTVNAFRHRPFGVPRDPTRSIADGSGPSTVLRGLRHQQRCRAPTRRRRLLKKLCCAFGLFFASDKRKSQRNAPYVFAKEICVRIRDIKIIFVLKGKVKAAGRGCIPFVVKISSLNSRV